MTPRKFCLVCLLVFCSVFTCAFSHNFNLQSSVDFTPQITALAFHSSPTNTRSTKYAQTQIALPVNLFLNENFSFSLEYFLSYSYFDTETDTYNKLNKANISYNTNKLSINGGRNFLDLGLNSVIYFGNYTNRDLKHPSYFDGVLANYKINSFINFAAVGGTFDANRDFYGAILDISYLKTFYFLSKEEEGLDLAIYGANIAYFNETFAIDLLAAFNKGDKAKIFLGLPIQEEYKGKMFAGNIKLKKEGDVFNSEISFGAEYLSPDKEAKGYRAINANLDRGFIFGNLTQDLQTLTYKLGLKATPNIIKDLTGEVKIYNITSTDKSKTNQDIASEINLSLHYQYNKISFELIYGYLQAGASFSSYATGFEDKPTINKLGFILSFQF